MALEVGELPPYPTSPPRILMQKCTTKPAVDVHASSKSGVRARCNQRGGHEEHEM